MATIDVKQKIYDVLKVHYFDGPDDLVDVSDGPDDSIHVVIVSRKFDGRRLKGPERRHLDGPVRLPRARRVE